MSWILESDQPTRISRASKPSKALYTSTFEEEINDLLYVSPNPQHVICDDDPTDNEDCISYEPLQSMYYKCCNPIKSHYFNKSTYESLSSFICPYDKQYHINQYCINKNNCIDTLNKLKYISKDIVWLDQFEIELRDMIIDENNPYVEINGWIVGNNHRMVQWRKLGNPQEVTIHITFVHDGNVNYKFIYPKIDKVLVSRLAILG